MYLMSNQLSDTDTLCPGDTADTLMIRNNTATVQFKWPRDFQGQGFLISYIEVNPGENLGRELKFCKNLIPFKGQ